MQAHGGWVCTATDLTRFLGKSWMTGQPRSGGRGSYAFYGSLPGTTALAVQRSDGINYVLLMNKRKAADKWPGQLKAILDAATK